jgi:GR25 family glycosyltransferase involved in LPS biosynthesis
MIRCDIISVLNTDNVKYNKRNAIISDFLSIEKKCDIDFNVSKAVTPIDWKMKGKDVIYDGETFNVRAASGHEHGITNYLSHYKIWREMGRHLVLEDDIIYDMELFNKLPDLIEKFDKIKINNKLLYLQTSCPWREGFPDKEYQHLIDYSEDFYILHNKVFNDVSGTAAYYMNINEQLLGSLKKEIGATDGILDNLLKSESLFFFIPKDFVKWFKLNSEVQ